MSSGGVVPRPTPSGQSTTTNQPASTQSKDYAAELRWNQLRRFQFEEGSLRSLLHMSALTSADVADVNTQLGAMERSNQLKLLREIYDLYQRPRPGDNVDINREIQQKLTVDRWKGNLFGEVSRILEPARFYYALQRADTVFDSLRLEKLDQSWIEFAADHYAELLERVFLGQHQSVNTPAYSAEHLAFVRKEIAIWRAIQRKDGQARAGIDGVPGSGGAPVYRTTKNGEWSYSGGPFRDAVNMPKPPYPSQY